MNQFVLALPTLPGVYLFKDAQGSAIYIGKAKNLRKRVQSYFVKQNTDWKVAELMKEYATIAHIVTKNETEALLLEAQLVKQYQPHFNTLLKSGQPFLYLLITEPKTGLPILEIVRNKKKKGIYFGPFIHKSDARNVHSYLLRTFQLFICNKKITNGCLDYHLGRCCGSCKETFDPLEYQTRLKLVHALLKNDHTLFMKQIQDSIDTFNKRLEFEKAAHISQYLKNFEIIFETIKTRFHERKYALEIEETVRSQPLTPLEIEHALTELQNLLKLLTKPRTIDCFDISHFQSNAIVGSCIRFTNGIKDPANFRRFKIKTLKEQNDYAALQEIVLRRYKDPSNMPDVVLIDGGKGQRNAIVKLVTPTPCISLAKREERLYTDNTPEGIKLDLQTPLGRLIIALRDYAHHFAITYHRSKRSS
jgi:excinuclease ABC subunit C